MESAEDLYQQAPFGYLTTNSDGIIININETLLKWLDFSRDEVVHQKSIIDLLSVGSKIYFESHIMPLLQMQGEVSEINIEFKGNNSTKFPVIVNARRVQLESINESLYRFSVLSISQRKLYESELMKAKKLAEQTVHRLKEINQELEQFAHIASHDLKAPLNTVSGLVKQLQKKGNYRSDSPEVKFYSLIERNLQRMKLMVNDLLDYSKLDAQDRVFELVSLNEVCEITLELIDDEVQKSHAKFNIRALPTILGDKLQLVRLFQNLFNNSIKYRSDRDPVIEVSFEEVGDEITVFVKDNGMGFDPAEAESIFGFMKRLHSNDSIPGTGIGLTTCKRIVELMGGSIGATSQPGKGTTIYFTFPRFEE